MSGEIDSKSTPAVGHKRGKVSDKLLDFGRHAYLVLYMAGVFHLSVGLSLTDKLKYDV